MGNASPDMHHILDLQEKPLSQVPPRDAGRAKSSSLNPLFSIKVTARASPRARVVVVLAVGARPRGQASSFTWISRSTSAGLCQSRLRIAGERDQTVSVSLDQGKNLDQFPGLTAVGDGNDHILFGQHPEITIHPFGWVEEEGRCPCAGKRGGDLSATSPDFPMPMRTTLPCSE